ERAVVVVVIGTGSFRVMHFRHFEGCNIIQRLRSVARHKDVGPAVVVVIEKPGREALKRFRHPGLRGYVGKLPAIGKGIPGIAWTIITEEMIWAALHRDIQVRSPAIIEISSRDTLHKSHVRHMM